MKPNAPTVEELPQVARGFDRRMLLAHRMERRAA